MLWRIKWWLTGILSDYIAEVLIRDGRGEESPRFLSVVALAAVVWFLTASTAVNAYSSLLAGAYNIAAVQSIVALLLAFGLAIHTTSAMWWYYDYFQQTPEQRVGVSE